jgi:alkanesulfonate monooxygenase SsuD/methylene tetrahydromethanopterin reductase-like flavin-dependent oxidoreductase (luciferase family)
MLADCGHIVVVDDDPSLRQMVMKYLEDNNVPAKSASNRIEFSCRFAGTPPSLIVPDLRLGQDDGLDLKCTPDQTVHAVPGAGLEVPIWLLGSSTFSAQQAAMLGLPFAFATHIGPDSPGAAIEIYRSTFKPSNTLSQPCVMIAVVVTAAETGEAAQYLFTSFQQRTIDHLRGIQGTLPRPTADLGAFATPDAHADGTIVAVCHHRLSKHGRAPGRDAH